MPLKPIRGWDYKLYGHRGPAYSVNALADYQDITIAETKKLFGYWFNTNGIIYAYAVNDVVEQYNFNEAMNKKFAVLNGKTINELSAELRHPDVFILNIQTTDGQRHTILCEGGSLQGEPEIWVKFNDQTIR